MAAPYEVALMRSAQYQLLSLAFLYPGDRVVVQLVEVAHKASKMASSLGYLEARDALDRLSQDLRPLTDEVLLSEYTEVFGHAISSDCPPYEGEYGQAHIFQKSQTLADLNTFYKAFGVTVSPDLKDRSDHISVEMEFMHLLTLKEAYAQLQNHGEEKVQLCREAQGAFLSDHLAPWVKSFSERLIKRARSGSIYASFVHLLQAHMNSEFKSLGIDVPSGRVMSEPLVSEDDRGCDGCPIAFSGDQEGVLP